jgi:hypothetical protein
MWDVVLSILLLIGNAVVFFGGAFMSVFVMAFTDNCPPGCDIDAAVSVVLTVGVVLGLLGIAATVVTILLLVRRRRAWWLPLSAAVVTAAGWLLAFAFYSDAVSAG